MFIESGIMVNFPNGEEIGVHGSCLEVITDVVLGKKKCWSWCMRETDKYIDLSQR